MKRRHLIYTVVTVLVCLAILPFAYAAGKEEKKTTVVVDKWKIPYITISTGTLSHAGVEAQWASKRAVDKINSSGGIAGKPVELDICDTGYDPARAVSCMKKAVDDSLVIIGPLSTMDVRSSAALAARQKVMCLPVASSITEVGKAYPWAVVFIPSAEEMAKTVQSWLKLYPEIKSVVIFRDTKNPIWVEYGNLYKQFCEEAGVKVLDVIDVPPESIDVSAPAIRGLGKKPDGFVLSSGPVEMARIIVELDSRGWKKKEYIAAQCAAGGESFFNVGGSAVDGVYILSWLYDFNFSNSEWQTFVSDYGKAFAGAKPALWVAPYYDVVYAVKEAIEKTGVTGDPSRLADERIKIRDYICSLKNFSSIYKPFNITEGGWAETQIVITRVKKGVPIVESGK